MERSPSASFCGTDRFQLRRCLGAGGFGTVYEAFDRQRDAVVALKLLEHFDAESLYRFKQEFRALADLAHPNLVTLYELFAEDSHWFFTMQLIGGRDFLGHVRPPSLVTGPREDVAFADTMTSDRTLATFTGDEEVGHGRVQDPLDLAALCDALLQLACGLTFLHGSGELHCDIKPSNVLCTGAGQVVILDLGLATKIAEQDLQTGGGLRGTPAYMSPEQARGGRLTAASDWYGVGVMLYQALAGRLPFEGNAFAMLEQKLRGPPPPVGELARGAPAELAALCDALLRVEPAERPTGEQLIAGLAAVATQVATRPSARRPSRAPGETAVIGRGRHLQQLAEAFAAAARGELAVVLCHGGSGMGKTTLARHFLAGVAAADRRVVTLTGRCYEYEEVPYKALDGVLDALSRFLRHLPAGEAEVLLPRDIHALVRLFPVLMQVPAVAAAPRRVIVEAQREQRAAFAALRELLVRLGDRRPVAILIDDLHWGDLDSLELLTEVIRPPDPPAAVIVLCFRSEERATSPVLQALDRLLAGPVGARLAVRTIEVGALDADESRVLVDSLLARAPSDRRHEVARESGGNPYLLTELANLVGDGSGELTAASTVDELVASRLAGVPEDARRLLEAVVVAGQPVARACVSAAVFAGARGPDELHTLAVLRADRWLRIRRDAEGEQLEPYHDRVRETILGRMAPAVLEDTHLRLARALEQHGGAGPERLAYHFHQAGHAARAAGYAAQAADQAREVLAFDRAAEFYRMALELGRPHGAEAERLMAHRADALAGARRAYEAAQAYRDLAERATVGAAAIAYRRLAAEHFLGGGYIDEGMRALDEVLRAVDLRLPRRPVWVLLGFLWLRLWILVRGVEFRERAVGDVAADELLRIDTCWSAAVALGSNRPVLAAAFQARHLTLALQIGEPSRVARALAMEGLYHALRGAGGRRRAERVLALAGTLAERTRYDHAASFVTYARAVVELQSGEYRRAAELLFDAETVLRERCTSVAPEVDAIRLWIGCVLVWRGDIRRLRTVLSEYLQDAEARGRTYAVRALTVNAGYHVQLAEDRPEEAAASVDRGLSGWPQLGVDILRFSAMMARMRIALYRGDGATAGRIFDDEIGALRRSGLTLIESIGIEVELLRAFVALACPGPPGLAARRLRIAARSAVKVAKGEMPHASPYAAQLRAMVAHRRGEVAAAVREMEDAERRYQAIGFELHAAAARRARGVWLGDTAGAALVAEADAWMREQSIVDPARMAAMIVPEAPGPAST